jgi:hypothetical protein
MHRRMAPFVPWVLVFLCASVVSLRAQEFNLFDHEVQVHGWLSQGFVYTNDNSWLTMNTSSGSGAMTDMGLNLSTRITDNFRVSAQVFDRNLGRLGQWHPLLDYAVADYRFTSWFGIRGGQVKTVFGLFNDTQDQDFLHTFALLPQSVYPTDLRDSAISHLGGDVYGKIALRRNLGDLSYTAYAGRHEDGVNSGYPYLLTQFGTFLKTLGGLQYGADLRWNTPLKGLLVGASRMDQDLTGKGSGVYLLNPAAGVIPYSEFSKADWTNQFYGEYAVGKLRIDSEYRRYYRDQMIFAGTSENPTDVRGWYVMGTYRVARRLEVGSYYSRYTIVSLIDGALAGVFPSQTDTSLPANHIYDKVIAARVDLSKYWNVKVEGHFMEGYGNSTYPDGFYPQQNPNGFRPDTNALVLKTSFHF